MGKLYEAGSTTTCVLLAIALILLAGFIMTRVTKKLRLPNVTGYILAGILIGPHVLNMVPRELVVHMDFMSDVALTCIAFGVGQFFKKEVLRKTSGGVLLITALESLTAGVVVTLAMRYLVGQNWSVSLILGAIATATAPASTMMTIKQYKAKGDFVSLLLQVVALDDAVCLLVFSVAVAVVGAVGAGGFSAQYVIMPIVWNILSVAVGAGLGWLLSHLITEKRTNDNRLILTIGLLLVMAGLCSIVDCSPLLACMVMSAVYINCTHDDYLYKILDRFTPPILSMFFVISGMNLDVTLLAAVGSVGVVYFITRIIGKLAGAFLGCRIVGTDDKISKNLGLALIPQAGVAIGLAILTRRIIPGAQSELVMTIILSSGVLYELIGPAAAKFALIRAGSMGKLPPHPGKREEADTPATVQKQG